MKHYIKNFVLVIAFLSVTIGLFSNVMNTVYAQDINVNGFSHPTCVDLTAEASEFVSDSSDIPFYAKYEYNAHFFAKDTMDLTLRGQGLTSGQTKYIDCVLSYSKTLDQITSTDLVRIYPSIQNGNILTQIKGNMLSTPKSCCAYYVIQDALGNTYHWNMTGYYLMDEATNS